ncbi:hypothetical protein Vadar_027147 [Vaccinium darrowii]|uniref:Uncharacterized protein n=1 Tax=Vaccinium darrowii TaxID=229202 RepID=A0ACB7X455_9ERIC|nr:hypothetical protein Vadar_027147 [Vaccinium darrowii]
MKHNVEANLYAFLCTKRYVMTIDDIWDIKAWNALKPGLPIDSEKGSRIILSSRNKNIGKDIGGLDSVFELQPPDPQTSRELFYKLIAHVSKNITETLDSPQLENISEQILERCHGLPLAIVLVAGLLKTRLRSQTEWKAILDGMG